MDRTPEPAPRITLEAFKRICTADDAPFQRLFGFEVEEIGHGWARARLPSTPDALRPGGTISGPAQMALADFVLYAAVMGALGEVAQAVTTTLTINFLQRPVPGDLHAECKLMKVGKRLAVGEVRILAEDGALVSHVTGTYSIPPAVKQSEVR